MNHTKGRWEVGDSVAMKATPSGERFLGVGIVGGRSVCRISGLADLDDEDEANADLIAAAPVLLDELIAVRSLASSTAFTLRMSLPRAGTNTEPIAKLFDSIALRITRVLIETEIEEVVSDRK